MKNAWAGGGVDDMPTAAEFQNFVDIAQSQMNVPQMPFPMPMPVPEPEPEPWYYGFIDVIGQLIEMGMPGYVILGCLAIGGLYVGFWSWGRAKKLPQAEFLNRFFKTLGNLKDGK